jgi:hypothetical protein
MRTIPMTHMSRTSTPEGEAPRVLEWLGQACEEYGAEKVAWAVGAIEYL